MNPSRISTYYAALLMFSLTACAPSTTSMPAPGLDFLNTVVAETVIGAQTQSAVPGMISEPFTFTPEVPLTIPTQTIAPIPAISPTPILPMISVSVATNCRSGPGKVYPYRGALLVGKVTEALAREPSGNYWLIRNPDNDGSLCWIWGEYATLYGNPLVLPVYTPPPTPTNTLTPTPSLTPTPAPTFNVSYASLDTCGPNWWVDLKLKNTGAIPLRSFTITVHDRDAGVTLVDLADGFTDIDGCLKTSTRDVIASGETYLLSAPAFSYKPAGNDLRLTLTICSDTGQKGLCTTETFKIVP